MADPNVRREGNCRFAALACEGLPANIERTYLDARSALEDQRIQLYGPPSVLFSLPADDDPPSRWPCQIGSAIIGLARNRDGLFIEDYRQLQALSLPHMDSTERLGDTYRRLADHARANGWRVRPYWRLALRRRRLADGNLLPTAEVSVFLDR